MNWEGGRPLAQQHSPEWLRRWSDRAWRLLLLFAVVALTFWLLQRVSLVVLAVLIALFPTALLSPPVEWLKQSNWPPLLASWAVILLATAALVGVGFLLVPQVIEGVDEIFDNLETTVDDVEAWLVEGPLGLSEQQIADVTDTALDQLQQAIMAGGAGIIGGAGRAIELLTGFVLVLVVSFFFLKDGDRLFDATIDRLSEKNRDRARRAGVRAWDTLGAYIRGLVIVGLVDAVSIGIGLAILGVPLVLPLSVFVFFGAFFPLIGAWISGLLAVAVAFASGGVTDALIVLAIITGVQQLEGDIVAPIVFRRTMKIHPLLILLAIAAGGIAFGIAGAFLAVPLLGVTLAVREELAADREHTLVPVARGEFDGARQEP